MQEALAFRVEMCFAQFKAVGLNTANHFKTHTCPTPSEEQKPAHTEQCLHPGGDRIRPNRL